MGLSQAQFLSFVIGAMAVWILVFQWTRASRDRRAEDDDFEDVDEPVSTATPANVGKSGSGGPS